MDSVVASSRVYEVRAALRSDIPKIVDVHLASFQNFFLTFLGRSFLEHLYTEIAAEHSGVVLAATSAEGTVIGFAAGVPHLAEFYKRLVRGKWLTFGLASMRAAFLRPTVIPRLGRALRAPKNAQEATCPGTLMSLAVAPEAKGMGIGKTLITQFLLEMKRNGIPMVCLTTDRDNNEATIGFYERYGFNKLREFQTREGRWLCEYMIETR